VQDSNREKSRRRLKRLSGNVEKPYETTSASHETEGGFAGISQFHGEGGKNRFQNQGCAKEGRSVGRMVSEKGKKKFNYRKEKYGSEKV